MPVPVDDARSGGRTAFEQRQWALAFHHMAAADAAEPLEAEDLEILATAAYLTGEDETSSQTWARAHHAFLDRHEPERAVRCAFWLGFGLFQRSEMAQGAGWMARGHRLVDEHALDCVECGYLLVPTALLSLSAGEADRAYEQFGEAARLGQRFDDADLTAFGRLGRGQSLCRMGQPDEGVRLFDEVMVSVTAGELSPVASGIVYCAVIDECQEVFDIGRAQEWTTALTRWCESQPDLVPFRGQCLVHRSQLLQLHGAWSEAREVAHEACDRLSDPIHPALGMAYYELGELYRLCGELDEAKGRYRHAHEQGRQPHPGLALLRLAQGKAKSAAAAIEAALAESSDPVARVRLLPAAVEIMLAVDRVDEARAAADELAELGARAGAPYLHATAAQWRGAVLLAEGDARGALEALRQAGTRWRDLDIPYEKARVGVLIAEASRVVGDDDTAELELDAARRTFEQLGAEPPVRSAAEVPLTSRELEVLQLVAAGRTNRQIADVLVISERTVERHVSNIFTKLGVPNRAAATASAYDLRLV